MFRHGERRLELIPFEANTIRSIKLPRDRLIKRIKLLFYAEVVVAGGAASGTIVEDAVQRLIQSIEVIGDGVVTLFRLTGRLMYYKNSFESGCPPYVLQPTTGDEGSEYIGIILDLWFADNIGIRPPDTNLNSPAFKTLVLRINWGDPDGMYEGTYDRGATISNAYGIRPILVETTKPAPIFLRLQDYIEKEVTATTREFVIEIPCGNRVYQALVVQTLDTQCKQSDIVNFTDIITGESFKHYQEIPFVQKQHFDEIDFHNEAIIAGYNYHYLLEDGRIPSGVHTFDVNSAKMRFDVTVGAGTTLVQVAHDSIVSL